MVSRYPSIVKTLVEQGNEVGIHTFTHVDLSYQSDARVNREMQQTQLALAGAAGITTTLFRAPYSSEADAIDNYSWPVYKKLGEEGYTSVFVDTDSDDWKRPGVSKIIKWATPEDGAGASVLFHDAGGERSQTIKALPTYIKKMKAAGYTFTTISGAIQQEQSSAQQAATGTAAGSDASASPSASATAGTDTATSAPSTAEGQQPGGAPAGQQGNGQPGTGQQGNGRQGTGQQGSGPGGAGTANLLQAAHRTATGATLYEGKALIAAVAVAEWAVPGLATGLVVVGFAVMGRFGMMLILARRHYRQRNRKRGKGGKFSWGPPVTEPVSVIVPAYNEKECIENTVRRWWRATTPSR